MIPPKVLERLNLLADEMYVRPSDVMEGRRYPKVVKCRDRLIRELHDEQELSASEIGRMLNFNHHTVLDSLKRTA